MKTSTIVGFAATGFLILSVGTTVALGMLPLPAPGATALEVQSRAADACLQGSAVSGTLRLTCSASFLEATSLRPPVRLAQAETPATKTDATPAPAPAPVTAPATAPKVLAEGHFHDGQPGHHGTGTARVTQAGTAAEVALVGFKGTAGPDLHVWLVAKDDPKKERDVTSAKTLDLGALKSASGDQTYAVPAGTDLSQYKSVVIWCKSFGVLFSAAPLKPAS